MKTYTYNGHLRGGSQHLDRHSSPVHKDRTDDGTVIYTKTFEFDPVDGEAQGPNAILTITVGPDFCVEITMGWEEDTDLLPRSVISATMDLAGADKAVFHNSIDQNAEIIFRDLFWTPFYRLFGKQLTYGRAAQFTELCRLADEIRAEQRPHTTIKLLENTEHVTGYLRGWSQPHSSSDYVFFTGEFVDETLDDTSKNGNQYISLIRVDNLKRAIKETKDNFCITSGTFSFGTFSETSQSFFMTSGFPDSYLTICDIEYQLNTPDDFTPALKGWSEPRQDVNRFLSQDCLDEIDLLYLAPVEDDLYNDPYCHFITGTRTQAERLLQAIMMVMYIDEAQFSTNSANTDQSISPYLMNHIDYMDQRSRAGSIAHYRIAIDVDCDDGSLDKMGVYRWYDIDNEEFVEQPHVWSVKTFGALLYLAQYQVAFLPRHVHDTNRFLEIDMIPFPSAMDVLKASKFLISWLEGLKGELPDTIIDPVIKSIVTKESRGPDLDLNSIPLRKVGLVS